MNKDEAIVKIKEQLKKLMAFSTEVANEGMKYEALKLKDGSEIFIPDGAELTPGVECFHIDQEGNQTPCEDGSYELESGETITVKGGVIEAVGETPKSGEQTQSPETEAQMAEKPSEAAPEKPEAETETETEGDLAERVASLEAQLAQILELLQGMSNAQEMAMSKINEIAEQPAVPSIKVGKTLKNSDVSFNSVKDEMTELKDLMKKFKINGAGGYRFNAASTK